MMLNRFKVSSFPAQEPKSVLDLMGKTETCLNCGCKLKYLPKKDQRRNRGYCSLDCFYTKPPKFVYLEQQHGKPVREVIIEALNQTHSAHHAADLLGISHYTLYSYMRKTNIKRITKYI